MDSKNNELIFARNIVIFYQQIQDTRYCKNNESERRKNNPSFCTFDGMNLPWVLQINSLSTVELVVDCWSRKHHQSSGSRWTVSKVQNCVNEKLRLFIFKPVL